MNVYIVSSSQDGIIGVYSSKKKARMRAEIYMEGIAPTVAAGDIIHSIFSREEFFRLMTGVDVCVTITKEEVM
jgi:hypothetical protein